MSVGVLRHFSSVYSSRAGRGAHELEREALVGLSVRTSHRLGWGPFNSTPSPAATTARGASRLAPRRGGAFPGSAARKRNWTDRRVLGAEAVRQWLAGEGRRRRPQAGSNTRSHQLQRTTREEDA